MTHNRMNPRRWFWTLMLGVALWIFVGPRFFGSAKSAPAAQEGDGLHGWLRDNTQMVLMPAAATLHWGQSKFETLGTEVRSAEIVDVKALRQENTMLLQQRDYLLEQIRQYESQLVQLNSMRSFPSLRQQPMVYANIRGSAPGIGDSIVIDRGSEDGIKAGYMVLSQLSLMGRVLSVNAKVSTVRLITDPDRSMWIIARLIRRTPNVQQTIVERCQVHGTGDGFLRCESIDATRDMIPPEKGDILLVEDNSWTLARGTELGRVMDVGRLENQNLRYDLKIQPMASLAETSQVGVIISP